VTIVFYVSAGLAVISTLLVITSASSVHALLYLILSLFSVALVFFSLGAPFVAALEIIIYAGAIMVLFVFVIMILNLGQRARHQERIWMSPRNWVGPAAVAGVLLAELLCVIYAEATQPFTASEIGPKQVGMALFGPYLLGVELASMLLLAAIVGAYHLGRRVKTDAGLDSEER